MAYFGSFLWEIGIVLIISVAVSQQKTSRMYDLHQKIFVLLNEICDLPNEVYNMSDISARFRKEFTPDVEIVFLNTPDSCDDAYHVMSVLMHELKDQRTVAVIGSTEPFLCETISKIADANQKPFIAWNCPQITNAETKLKSNTIRLFPAIRDVVGAMLSLFKHFRWKRTIIVTVENSAWWILMASELDFFLSNGNISTSKNSFIILPLTATHFFIENQFRKIMKSRKLIDNSKSKIDEEYSRMYHSVLLVLAQLPITVPVIVIRLSSSFKLQSTLEDSAAIYHEMVTLFRDPVSDVFSNNTNHLLCDDVEYTYLHKKTDNLNVLKSNSTRSKFNQMNANNSKPRSGKQEQGQENKTKYKFSGPPRQHSDESTNSIKLQSIRHHLLILSLYLEDQRTEDWFSLHIKMSANILRSRMKFENLTNFTSSEPAGIQFMLSDLTGSSSRKIALLRKNKSNGQCSSNYTGLFNVTQLIPDLHNWFSLKMRMKYNISSNELSPSGNIFDLSVELILLIIFVVVVAMVFVSCIIITARKQYVHRRRMKDPYKILLTAEDIVFPQIQEASRVEDGIEAMLCCWLQELHEFGGPEVDKPDLLKGPDDSVKSFPLKHVNSSNSVTKPTLSTEIKARYNGDLVQLKDISVHGSTFELRSKSLNVLMMIHELRHENLNPLIGLLVDPVRPALVWEYCSRGSLEDILMQDEIKLDWSFRLSLLTDLVRGMKYLHSYPYRIHGSLTSRNCVIDARWVLKITDYCLHEFNEAQNIITTCKSARDLLWTAPELLRNETLMKKGSQQGDIYSFAIIMQEVVVRGEPFCMLSLTAEDIIEKLKTPPPLIRPSVSKGAAPPEAINIMRQCWAEQPEKRPDFNAIYDLFKTLNHGRKINFVDTMFQMLEKYSNNLEDLIRERTEQLDMEKKKTEQLLNRMLPYSVAEKLKLGMHVDPEEFSEVTIYFSDIVGFTTISAYSTPFEVVDLLNDLYTCFDATINAYNVYKVETIGDAYMVVGGLPVRIPDHADQVATMALDLLHQSGQFKIRHLPSTPLRLRIGLHTGPCCAGVVGLTMPRYCLFGDTVNTASRLETTGSPGRIHISETTKLKLDIVGKFKLEYRGETELKGKGKMPTYWLLGKEGFEKEIPVPPPVTLDEELIRNSTRRSQRTLDKHSSRSNGEQEVFLPNNSKLLISQKSLDSGLVLDSSSSHNNKTWTARRQMTFDLSDRNEYYKHAISFEQKMKQIPETNGKLTNSGMDLSFSTSDKNIDSVGVPFVSNKTTIMTNTNKTRKYVGDEVDLSTPYNYYRCLPPAENPSSSKFVSKFLKRQFSMDKSDDSSIVLQEFPISKTGHLFKQNSAGANHDNEKTNKSQTFKYNNNNIMTSMSVSAESLT